jgi:hypothetical protein
VYIQVNLHTKRCLDIFASQIYILYLKTKGVYSICSIQMCQFRGSGRFLPCRRFFGRGCLPRQSRSVAAGGKSRRNHTIQWAVTPCSDGRTLRCSLRGGRGQTHLWFTPRKSSSCPHRGSQLGSIGLCLPLVPLPLLQYRRGEKEDDTGFRRRFGRLPLSRRPSCRRGGVGG